MRNLWWIYALCGTVVALCLHSTKTFAHPHVQVQASASLLFSGTGQVIGIEHHWQFDEAYSAFAVQGLDTNKDGTISREELAGLAIGSQLGGKAGLAQALAQVLAGAGLVFDDQQFHALSIF